MAKTIRIEPVTRVEGHAKITLVMDDSGRISDARFHVNEFRGFEKFCEGRMFTEMPNITPRICGICPVSHAVSSAKACENIMRVSPPPAATLLRRLMHLGQIISSHALSYFHLSSPDFLFGWDSDPAQRNILGLAEKYPDLARRGIRLRQFGQELSERITGKKIHSVGIAAGGMLSGLSEDNRRALLEWIPEALDTTQRGLDLFKTYADSHVEEMNGFARFASPHLGTVGPLGEHELYDGRLRWIDETGAILADQIDPARYAEFIAERPVSWSYLKMPYFKSRGFPEGAYRVGPLARINVATRMRTPRAEAERKELMARGQGRPLEGNLYYHYARLVEILTSVELVQEFLSDPAAFEGPLLAHAGRNQAEGVGSSEAPRGTLFHHYAVDEHGLLTRVNLLIATGQNNPAMNRAVLEVARQYVQGLDVKEGALNRVEGAIRCFDPCLSCSTHALGRLPIRLEWVSLDGRVLKVL